ncbi:hypothetical protein [Burkholderia multivorans]|uniref:hypothetical protein n=1 Tax=Burkholderia multivorans TaxID=87883 RepID=UPI0015E35624|nr:hypothetical protein [Burkholderia multivorans]MBU9589603.1 hypothetical protein [Burkholderia multivorans]
MKLLQPNKPRMITTRDEGYEDVVPELIAEDALHVHPYGWTEGFEIEVLNQAG